MIRHWVEAMGDENPVYVSDEAAREAGYDRLIAPPTMLQAWIMRGLRASMVLEEARAAGTTQGSGPNDVMMGLLDDEGLTSVVATNCEQQYGRPLVVGDRLVVRSVIESISDPKRTALGTGRFVTNRMDYVAVPDADVPAGEPVSPEQVQALFDAGEPVATQRFRILKYLPPDRPASHEREATAPAPGDHPGQRLLVRRCPCPPPADPALHVVRHLAPPAPARPAPTAARSNGTRSSRAAGAPCTPTSWCTTRRWPPSSTRCRSAWSSSRRGPASWRTSAAWSPRRLRSGWSCGPSSSTIDEELSLPVFVPARCWCWCGSAGSGA